jgi:C-terminal processing protease CtpA/Prc
VFGIPSPLILLLNAPGVGSLLDSRRRVGPHYRGPITVLTSPSTCSAAEDFLVSLKMSKRITIVGAPTGGSTGQPLTFSFYGATACVCTKRHLSPGGNEFMTSGFCPM